MQDSPHYTHDSRIKEIADKVVDSLQAETVLTAQSIDLSQINQLSRYLAKRLPAHYGYHDTASTKYLQMLIASLHQNEYLYQQTLLTLAPFQADFANLKNYLQGYDRLIQRLAWCDVEQYASAAQYHHTTTKYDALYPPAAILLIDDEWLVFRANFLRDWRIFQRVCLDKVDPVLPLIIAHDNKVSRQTNDIILTPVQANTAESIINKPVANWLDHLDSQQRLAVERVSQQNVTLIYGGAGTGKTTTLCRALAQFLCDQPNANMVNIAIAAPSGKAVKRLKESFAVQLAQLKQQLPENIYSALAAIRIQTLHQLLQFSQDGLRAHRHANNPLIYDLIAIDECSMLSSDLFYRLLDALILPCKLVLLGDEKQLPPVNASGFFNTLAMQSKVQQDKHLTETPIAWQNRSVKLEKSFRFAEHSPIHQVAQNIEARDLSGFIQTVEATQLWCADKQQFFAALGRQYFNQTGSSTALIERIQDSVVLCLNNQGEHSVTAVNRLFDQYCQQRLLDASASTYPWYTGRPIMIKRNDYRQGLFNGDVGFCEIHQDVAQIRFADDHCLLVEHLASNYELAFAMSVHKSQGSEYRHVHLLLDSQQAKYCNLELLYTAVTRAKEDLWIYAEKDILMHSFNKSPSDKTLLDLFLQRLLF